MILFLIIPIGLLVILISTLILTLLAGGGGSRPRGRDISGIVVGILVVLVGLAFLGAVWLIEIRYGY
jgi:hypothetical protein